MYDIDVMFHKARMILQISIIQMKCTHYVPSVCRDASDYVRCKHIPRRLSLRSFARRGLPRRRSGREEERATSVLLTTRRDFNTATNTRTHVTQPR